MEKLTISELEQLRDLLWKLDQSTPLVPEAEYKTILAHVPPLSAFVKRQLDMRKENGQ